MSSLSPLKNHPLRFLLYLEWISLFTLAFAEMVEIQFERFPRLPLLNLFCLAMFGIMGLLLPGNKLLTKIIYTLIEILLISLANWVGYIRMPILLYLIFMTRNSTIFSGRVSWTLNGLSFLSMLIFLRHKIQLFFTTRPDLREEFSFVLSSLFLLFGLHIILLQLLVNSVLSERASRSQLAIANTQLREYALRIEEIATLQERNRIAREIHDSLGHYLTVLNINIEAAWKLRKSAPDEAEVFLSDAKKIGSKTLQEVRQSVATLRCDPWQNQSIEAALTTLVQDFQKSTGVLPQIDIFIHQPLANDVKIAIYRIVQEALTNICKYAKSTEVKIQLKMNRTLCLTIQDNGKGFKISQNTTGFGLQSMRERTLALGGDFELVTSPGMGCNIRAEFPLTSINKVL